MKNSYECSFCKQKKAKNELMGLLGADGKCLVDFEAKMNLPNSTYICKEGSCLFKKLNSYGMGEDEAEKFCENLRAELKNFFLAKEDKKTHKFSL